MIEYPESARRSGAIQRSADLLLGAIVPPLCLVCRRPTVEPRSLCGSCWRGLDLIEPPLCPILGTPLAFDAGEGARSPELRWNHPLYDRARAATVFGSVSRELVHQLKYRDVPGAAQLMARLMIPRLRDLLAGADLLLPVPLHRGRLLSRRFNQAALLAKALAQHVGLPLELDLLRRVRATPHQVGLDRGARADNLHRAFSVRDPSKLAGSNVIVVDDVLTSGATADAIAMTLRGAGAARVDVMVFARVVGDTREPI